MNRSKSSRTKLPTRTIVKWVLWSVMGTLVYWYANALMGFAGNTYSYNNRFAEVAMSQHLFYLIWNNVEIMKGYALVGLFCAAMVLPLVLTWSKWRPFGRIGAIWRTLIFAWVFYAYFIFKVMLHKPYFGDYSYFDHSWNMVGQWFGSTVQHWILVLVLQVFPVLAIAFSSCFYLKAIYVGLSKGTQKVRVILAAVIMTVAALGLWWTFKPSKDPALVAALQEGQKRKKNILILGSDSLRGDRLGTNGYARNTSPAMDKLAREGVNFTRHFTPTGSTLESLTSLFTAQYPHTHGIQHMFPKRETVERVKREVPGLATVLKNAGYETAVIGDWCAAAFRELPMGFEDVTVSDFDNFKVYMSEVVYLHHEILPMFFDNAFGHWLFPKLKSFANFMTPNVVTEQIIDKLQERADDEKPFLLFGYYSCTHIPYRAPREYTEMWSDPEYDGVNKHMLALNVDEFIGDVDVGKKWERMPDKEVAQINAVYDSCVRMFDDCVGKIIDHLEKTGLKDNTIVVITGDHGDDLFEPNVTFGHGLSFNGGDQSNHIPFIIFDPELEDKGRVIDKISRSIDMAPTMLELSHNGHEPSFEGKSLAPYFKDAQADLKLAWYGETSYLFFKRTIPGEEPLYIPAMDETTSIDPSFNFQFVLKDKYADDVLRTKERCVRTERFKLVYTPGKHGPIYRMYDLVSDKHCEKDIKKHYPEVFEKLKTALYAWRDDKREMSLKEIFGEQNEFDIQPSAG